MEEERERDGQAELICFPSTVYLNVWFWSWLNLYHLWFFCCLKSVIADNVLLCWPADCKNPVHVYFLEQKKNQVLSCTKRRFLNAKGCVHKFPNFLLSSGGVPKTVRSKVWSQEVKASLTTRDRESEKPGRTEKRTNVNMYMDVSYVKEASFTEWEF